MLVAGLSLVGSDDLEDEALDLFLFAIFWVVALVACVLSELEQ